ncbi:MAG TPA: PucR family transcriptional regulator ligand-binding domain-containing protein [Actinocrinis sp.]|nr:PucR family transcriptional regulator ligand-binding domain-containing protein [Actinocrinis sp.]
MRIRELLDAPTLGLTAVTGDSGLDRELGSVMVTDLPDPARYLRGGELVVSGLVWLSDPRKSPAEHCELFVGAVARAGCAGLAAGDATDAPLPGALLESCAKHGVPLLHVPAQLAFADLTEWISRRISAERAGDAGELLARHRRLVAAGARQGFAGLVRLIAQETGMACGVLAATGEVVAADGAQPSPAARTAITRESLRTAALSERLVEYRGRTYSVYTVPGRPGTAVTDWYAVFEGDWRTWPRQRREAARGAARLVGAERARVAEAQRPLRRVCRELVTLAADAAPIAEIGARLTLAGLDPAAGLRAVAVATAGTVRVGRLTRILVEPADSPAPVPIAVFPGMQLDQTGADDPSAWAESAFAVAISLAPEDDRHVDPPEAAAPDEASDTDVSPITPSLAAGPAPDAAGLRARLTALAPGLGRDRVAIGISDRITQTADLTGAIEEARLAMRLAMRRPGLLEIAGHDELASHLVLLAHVPDDLRRGYRERLLGPLRVYDARHHSQLEQTLDRFLACSASWSRCAQELHIHVNTLRYRIDKINQLTGRDLGRLDHQVDFYLALRAR